MKINSSAKHDKKNNQDHNKNTSETNNENTQHAIETANKKISKSLYKNNIRSADQLNTWNLKYWKLYNLSAHIWHHKNLWQNDSQASCSHAENKKNINKNNQLNIFFYDRLNHYSSASRL